jgi:SulP family sulfate permease
MPALPDIEINLENLRKLSSPAIAIALLGAIESLLSAVVADGMTGFRHRSNMELVAQGIANIASPLFGGLPATGAIARTATNVKNGARTPIAGMIHALTLLIIMLFLGRWAALIPLSTLAGILLVVAYHMSEWRHFLHLFRSPRHDIAVLLVTFFLTVLVDLTVAIQVGMVLAAFLFMHRMANVTQAGFVTKMLRDNGEGGNPRPISERDVPAGVEVFEIYGSFFFGAASKFRDALSRVEGPPKVLILRMREVSVIDATGLRALEELLGKAAADGTKVLMSGLQPQPRRVFERSGLIERIGEENICADIDCALSRSREILGAVPVPAPAAGG